VLYDFILSIIIIAHDTSKMQHINSAVEKEISREVICCESYHPTS